MSVQHQILYVDDDEALVCLVEHLLRDAGYGVTTCVDATGALQLLEAYPDRFDLVVSDMNMPGMSGLEFARQMLAIHPQLSLALVSGYVDPEQHRQAQLLGVRKLIRKPGNIHELVKELAGLVL
ncbi:MAG: response regulator [Steroidobacteraceae bacterium]